MNSLRPHAIVIGAGIAGLASAVRLAVKGYSVSVFETNAYPGGKLTAFEQEGFRFDAGPSLFTMPHFVEELFTLSGRKTEDYFRYRRLTELCHYFYEDGSEIHAASDRRAFAKQLADHFGEEEEVVFHYLKKQERAYEITEPLFIRSSLHLLKSYLNVKTLKGIFAAPSLGIFSSMHEVNSNTFKDPRTVQLFNRFATYNGSDPYQAPGLMNVIPHLEHGVGAFIPEGGMHSITLSIYQLAKDLGVQFYFNTSADKILHTKGKVTGVQVNETAIQGDVVVSNRDVFGTYRQLLQDVPAPERLLHQPRSSSALIFYWGIKEEFAQLGLHNILFSENYKAEFEHIFKLKSIYKDPTVYINISSKEQPSDAPKGMENWFVMINVPTNEGQNWDQLISQAKAAILDKLSRMLKKDISALILNESILDPTTIELRTSSVGGSLYGNSSNNRYAAFLRHANFSSRIKNLYFVGGSVHPGGGIPLALSSAAIVGDMVASVR